MRPVRPIIDQIGLSGTSLFQNSRTTDRDPRAPKPAEAGEAYHLSAAQKGLLTAVPALGGSFFRPVLGWMTERFGGGVTALIGLAFTLLPLLAGWK